MEDLINFVSKKAMLPLPDAKVVASATLDYLTPRLSPLLRSTIDVMLQYPDLSDAEKDMLVASRILFPTDNSLDSNAPLTLND
ncbi:MAG: hypothetical protein H6656_17595 [Ardenticatenaceae bacterium]|nr:hypothetical protein [Anaerolineales bacterium]MCB9009145.1 hypothetical protein [Ardenticatenaceae bacterium]